MIEVMTKTGRIIRIRCEFYQKVRDEGSSVHTADEVILELLLKAPEEEYLRGPYVNPEISR